MDGWAIREVTEADVEAVVALVSTVLGEFGLSFGEGSDTDDALRRLPGSYIDHGGQFWVAEACGVASGTLGLFPVGDDTFELRKMYLSREARGKGLASALFDVAVAWARGRGARQIVLDTTEQMTAAIRFYERRGFVRDDDQIRGSRCSRGYRLVLPHLR
jgi:putative acetyltransferase